MDNFSGGNFGTSETLGRNMTNLMTAKTMKSTQPEKTTDINTIVQRVERIDPISYARTRNFIDGDVTYLSPYISRGVISTKYVLERTLERGFNIRQIEKFIQELAWREFFQRTWQQKGSLIDRDLRNPQENVGNSLLPKAIVTASTNVEALDTGIERLFQTGYMHNHIRMYVASVACNIGRSHWLSPARWMYYHLLDGDWASNALSWQWVAGTASNKKYFANQENINRYCRTNQTGTFLDVDYSELDTMDVPKELVETTSTVLTTSLPDTGKLLLNRDLPTLIYNSYNLDPHWHTELDSNRILLLEPSHFRRYPVSPFVIDFLLRLSKNINGLQIFVGEFAELIRDHSPKDVRFKEHPLNRHYVGTEESREWMFEVTGDHRSFFAFWKKCEKQLSFF